MKLTELLPLKVYPFTSTTNSSIALPVNAGRQAYFDMCCIINLPFISFEKTSSYWSVQFSLFFIGLHMY